MNDMSYSSVPYGVRNIAPFLGMVGDAWAVMSSLWTVTAFASQNMVVLSEPGDGKSEAARRFAAHFPGGGGVIHCKPDVNSTSVLIGQVPDPNVLRNEGRVTVRREGVLSKTVVIFDELSRLTENMQGSMLPGLNANERMWSDEIRPACDACMAVDPNTTGCHHLPWQVGIACVNFLHVNDVTKATWDRFLMFAHLPSLDERGKVSLMTATHGIEDYTPNPDSVFDDRVVTICRQSAKNVVLDDALAECVLRAFGNAWTGRRARAAAHVLRMAAVVRTMGEGNWNAASSRVAVDEQDLWLLPYLASPGSAVDTASIDEARTKYREKVKSAAEVALINQRREALYRVKTPTAPAAGNAADLTRFVAECVKALAETKVAREALVNTVVNTNTAQELKEKYVGEARQRMKDLQTYQNDSIEAALA